MVDKPYLIGIKTLDDGKKYAAHWTPDVADYVQREFPKAKTTIWHNSKYDLHMLQQGGVSEDAVFGMVIHCTMLTEILLDEWQQSYSLDELGKTHLGVGKDTDKFYRYLASIFGGPADRNQLKRNAGAFAALFHENPHKHAPNVIPYLFGDLDRTAGLFQKRTPRIALDGLDDVYALEMETTKSLLFLERTGVPVDQKALQTAIVEFTRLFELSKVKTAEMAGRPTNVMSSPSLITAFNRLEIPLPKLGEKVSFKKDLLEDIDHPFCKQVLYERMVRKMNEAFGTGFLPYIGSDGRVHTTFNQMRGDEYGTITGRLSSSGPNMQQIPKRNAEMCKHLRSVFVAPKGYEWICGDWSQFEFRVFAHYTNDEQLIGTYRKNPKTDYHQALTDIIVNPALNRERVKRINLGLVFGMGEGKLAAEAKLPHRIYLDEKSKKMRYVAGTEAKELFSSYHTRFPGAKDVLTTASNLAKKRGYVKTLSGRRIRFPQRGLAYKAGGLVFQGTSADMMKMKLNQFVREFRKTDTRPILPVHDEFNLLTPKGAAAKKTAKAVREIMQDVPQLRVPILAEVGVGPNWYMAGENQI